MATDLIPLGDPSLRQKVRLGLVVNGERKELLVDGYKSLLELLREELGLTGTKHGCELGECGACAVLLDGEAVLSCLALPIECQAPARIVTVEGLGMNAVQQSMMANHGAQCGYCTPGFVVAMSALFETCDRIDEKQVPQMGVQNTAATQPVPIGDSFVPLACTEDIGN